MSLRPNKARQFIAAVNDCSARKLHAKYQTAPRMEWAPCLLVGAGRLVLEVDVN